MKKKVLMILCLIFAMVGIGSGHWYRRPNNVVYSGTIEATQVDISTQLSSPVSAVMVQEGQEVEEGSLLLLLACEDLKVALEQVKRDWDRAQKLQHDGSISQESYEHAQSKFEEMRVKSSWCEIHSPLKGHIISIYREKGELVLPGQKLLTIADLTQLWSYIYIAAPEMKFASIGKELDAYLPQFDKKIKVTIIHINAQAEFTPKNVQTREERERLVYGIKVQLATSDLKIYPGMSLEVSFEK